MTQFEVSYPNPLIVKSVPGFQVEVASRIDLGLFMKSAYDSAAGNWRGALGVVKKLEYTIKNARCFLAEHSVTLNAPFQVICVEGFHRPIFAGPSTHDGSAQNGASVESHGMHAVIIGEPCQVNHPDLLPIANVEWSMLHGELLEIVCEITLEVSYGLTFDETDLVLVAEPRQR